MLLLRPCGSYFAGQVKYPSKTLTAVTFMHSYLLQAFWPFIQVISFSKLKLCSCEIIIRISTRSSSVRGDVDAVLSSKKEMKASQSNLINCG